MDITAFTEQFLFNQKYRGFLGVERECFISKKGKIVPEAQQLLSILPIDGRYSYELSACQLETKTNPVEINFLETELLEIEKITNRTSLNLGFELIHTPVAPEDISLEVYPDPTGRYYAIAKRLSCGMLSAACRIAAVHIHIGVSSSDEAIEVHGNLVDNFSKLTKMGDTCSGKRLKLYKVMVPNPLPRKYYSWVDFYTDMRERGFAEKPRECWDLIRISPHGTVEVRVFDSTPYVKKITNWAEAVLDFSGLRI
jgi:gamma-glutamyl:cysteine ligase YbdK (ATP-grasp superfamily)